MDTDNLTVLAIDVGGSHVKIRTGAGSEERKAVSGPKMNAAGMADAVEKLAGVSTSTSWPSAIRARWSTTKS